MRLVLTGGGSGGHVTPNVAVIKELRKQGFKDKIFYIASNGMEKEIILNMDDKNLEYLCIKCGKLRRYFSLENFLDFFRVIWGTFQSYFLLKKIKADLVFSKGGFVSLPVVIAAKLRAIPVYIHESDMSPGLTNKIAARFADKILLGFEGARKGFDKKYEKKLLFVGNPVRLDVLKGDAEKIKKEFNFKDEKKALFVTGGGQGSMQINNLIWENLDYLLKDFNIIHQVGKGKLNASIKRDGYVQKEFIMDEIKDVFAYCDYIISRAGANSVAEFAVLKKKVLLIPMVEGSRGDQILNAKEMSEKMGFLTMDKDFSNKNFKNIVKNLLNMQVKDYNYKNGLEEIVKLIINYDYRG